MNTAHIYFTGLLVAITVASIAIVTAQNGNDTLNSTILNPGNISNMNLNQSAVNNITLNQTKTEEMESLRSGSSHNVTFVIGEADGNDSAFNIGTPQRPAKDASKLWYLIQAVPHGYV